MWKNRAGQATGDNMAHAHYMLDIYGYKHSQYVMLIVFPLQQWSHELASLLRYTYIACLVKYCLIQSHFLKNPGLFVMVTELNCVDVYTHCKFHSKRYFKPNHLGSNPIYSCFKLGYFYGAVEMRWDVVCLNSIGFPKVRRFLQQCCKLLVTKAVLTYVPDTLSRYSCVHWRDRSYI